MLTHPQNHSSRPFLKWAGGKQRLLKHILPHLCPAARLVEPFVGAGAIFLAADFDSYLLNDANADLVALWTALRERPREFVRAAEALFVPANHSQEAYLRIRAEFNACSDRFERAVRLLYLNRFGFNGIFRVNSRGVFNVPYGRPVAMPTFPADELEAAAQKLARATILSGGFEGAMEESGAGDVVYCDPPYSDSSTGKSFVGYTESGFGQREHMALEAAARRAADRGASILISNHDTPSTRALYDGWEVHSLSVRRSVAAAAAGRVEAKELLAVLRPSLPG